MRKTFLRLCFVLSLSCTSVLVASAEQQSVLSPRQQQIFRQIAPVDGVLTEELHREFWSYVPEAVRNNPVARAELQEVVSHFLPAALRFQREVWTSIKMSAQAGKVIFSPGYETVKQRITNDKNETLRKQAREGAATAERMIHAAANKRPFPTQSGNMYLTPELADTVLGGLDASVARVEKLADPVWNTELQEFSYPEAHVSVLSHIPFKVDRSSLTHENGRTANMVNLNVESADEYLSVGFMALGGQWPDPDKAIMNTAKKAFEGAGAVPIVIYANVWRGRRSVEGTGVANTSQGTVYLSLRVVEDREHGGAHIIQAITQKSQVEAESAREMLESNVQFLP